MLHHIDEDCNLSTVRHLCNAAAHVKQVSEIIHRGNFLADLLFHLTEIELKTSIYLAIISSQACVYFICSFEGRIIDRPGAICGRWSRNEGCVPLQGQKACRSGLLWEPGKTF
jgi:hypothetical protein